MDEGHVGSPLHSPLISRPHLVVEQYFSLLALASKLMKQMRPQHYRDFITSLTAAINDRNRRTLGERLLDRARKAQLLKAAAVEELCSAAVELRESGIIVEGLSELQRGGTLEAGRGSFAEALAHSDMVTSWTAALKDIARQVCHCVLYATCANIRYCSPPSLLLPRSTWQAVRTCFPMCATTSSGWCWPTLATL